MCGTHARTPTHTHTHAHAHAHTLRIALAPEMNFTVESVFEVKRDGEEKTRVEGREREIERERGGENGEDRGSERKRN